MTAVMRAMSVAGAEHGPKGLRIGVVRAGRIVEERVLKERMTVTVGAAETATFVIASLAPHARPTFKLFERIGDDYWLVAVPGMTGRIAIHDRFVTLDASTPPLKLGEDARGKIILGDTTLLFQLVAKPIAQPRPQLPLAVKAGLRNDWTLTFIVAVSFLVHFGLVGSMYSDWTDPIVGDPYDVKGLVDLVSKIPVPPVEVPEQTALTSPDQPKTPEKPASATSAATAPRSPVPGSGTIQAHRTPSESTTASDEHAAQLAARAQNMNVQILVGMQGGPAVAGAVERSNVPMIDLSGAAERNVGAVRGNSELKTGAGGPVAASPDKKRGLTAFGNTTSDGTGLVAGHETATNGPTAVANIGISKASMPIPNADATVAGLRGRFRSCYQTGLLGDATMSGKVVISATIAPNGEVSSADIASMSGLSPAVAQCISGVVRRATFAKPSGGGSSTLQIPVTFVHL
jgi:hypothetical protein